MTTAPLLSDDVYSGGDRGSKLEGTPAIGLGIAKSGRAFAFGASSALVSSPCSSPVLASLLGFVASSATTDMSLSLGLLFAYTAGYTTPVVGAAALGTAVCLPSDVEEDTGVAVFSEYTSPVLAAFLIAYGAYSTLDALASAL